MEGFSVFQLCFGFAACSFNVSVHSHCSQWRLVFNKEALINPLHIICPSPTDRLGDQLENIAAHLAAKEKELKTEEAKPELKEERMLGLIFANTTRNDHFCLSVCWMCKEATVCYRVITHGFFVSQLVLILVAKKKSIDLTQ